jgi:DNA polymerase bacteriophage-type
MLLFLDYETYYDREYTLKKLTPPEYILDARYETLMCGVQEGLDNRPFIVDGPDFPKFISQYDPATTTTVTFNALFDNCILAWRYGFVPARMLCAMRMAAALRGHLLESVSMASVCKLFKLRPKGTYIESMLGKHRADLRQNLNDWNSAVTYCLDDTQRCAEIFSILAPEFPSSERRVMDKVLRCAVEPHFRIDIPMLTQHLVDLETEKADLLAAAGVSDAGDLRSNDKFASLLTQQGVDIEFKQSLTDPNRFIPAFAKTDEFMSVLQEHDNRTVQTLAAARLGVRSTIEQSRAQRMLTISSLPWPSYCRGNMPIPLRYSGAHTHRLSGEWKINMQNLPSGRGTKLSKLRASLGCSETEEVVAGDLAQIEARVTAWLCGQHDLLDQFAKNLDPYSILASLVFGFKVDKKIHLIERFIGKSGVLGLGFRCGAKKFYNMVIRSARALGMDIETLLKIWTPELAQKTVDAYRQSNRAIVNAWYRLDDILASSWCGFGPPQKWGPVVIGEGYVELPNGMKMVYNVQSRDATTDDGLTYSYGRRISPMHGGVMLENVVQALARIIVMHAALRLWDKGIKFRLQSHDELVFIVPKDQVEQTKAIVLEEMSRRPSWAQGLPLAAEVGSGPSYGDAK